MPPPNNEPKSPFRWKRISLRGLMVMVAAFAIWLGWRVNAARHQERVVLAIYEADGDVWYDGDHTFHDVVPEGTFVKPDPLLTPWWYERVLGYDLFHRVHRVELSQGEPSAALVEEVTSLRELKFLALRGPAVDDRSLRLIASLPRLEELWLYDTRVTDQGLERLSAMKKLDSLHLGGTKIGDRGLASLSGMTHLRSLNLNDTNVTDAGVGHLVKLRNLEALDIQNTAITDTSVACLCTLKKLRYLIASDGISDEGESRIRRETSILDAEIADYGDRISRDPKKPSLFHLRSEAYREKGEDEKADDDFREATRLEQGPARP